MKRVSVTRPDLPGDAVASLAARADVEVDIRQSHEPMSTAEAAELVGGADAVVATGMDRFPAPVLAASGSLRVVSTASVGVDQIDVAAAAERGIVVTNVPATMADACADYTFGLILAARRRIAETDRLIRAGAWRQLTMHQWLGADVSGSRLGLVGFGAIARAVARRAGGFGMDVVHHDRSQTASSLSRWVPLAELLSTSDIVSLHVPLTNATTGLVDDGALAQMRPSATLVNTSRGPVVDTAALVRALTERRLHSVALDVFETEPIADRNHPLTAFSNVVLAPHASSATESTRAAMVARAVANVVAVLDGGEPLDPVVVSR